ALGDADWLVRLYAVEALARMGPAAAAAAPELEALAAAGDDEPARLAAGYALERIRARRAGGAGGPGEAAKAGEATGAGGAAQARESR
ncbi:MAG: hypothetical protein HY721_18295, partial [Planctomycetes bacterium]|nr:hypothetical protein [Planctomycetota bacterium]